MDPYRAAHRRGRRRQAASVCIRNRVVLRALIAASQRSARFGPLMTPETFELTRDAGARLLSGEREYEDGEAFFWLFGGRLPHEALRSARVLDLGCGYGGRTVYYAQACGAAAVEGLEISARMVERCRAFARAKGAGNVSFSVGLAEALPYETGSFDAVVSYDVLEHVEDPVRAIAEMARVLRPGGKAWLAFPSYRGALASHLDYLTRIPALHRLFDPGVLVDVVNEFLRREPDRLGVGPQPPPHVSPLGHLVLPTLNGLTLAEARELIRRAGFLVEAEVVRPLLSARSPLPLGPTLSRALSAWHRAKGLPELLVGTLAVALSRP